ncbi:hypothetical protein LOZ61_003303 [Ophidiomyces ophidiicola]|nr:uncharacterized protein LOZ57_005660 [Ophidiomyces ophidiicola]KAI1912473.1 hypothetical protein LOZ61_003303 [Ophidiomyces ophidiicola]KAI1916064.1 hypothetical protein LOZ64_003444 [Ophidiomyces ophidiicola]KAI1941531.1 hypothetical protein LOZ57_005660 [Ophidiomyces ophidiicola]KAI1957826.1 hypothetical protein LOZ59_003717 [Ophidiomyces ophidiicola]KAI1966146.1 hypothetical protein LOZ56_005890 [Ophidiomyces ophidiicola]
MVQSLVFLAMLAMPVMPMPTDTSRIIGGTYAKPGDITHIVGMQYNDTQGCGASLLSEKVAITAAHCIVESKITVRAGSVYIFSGGTRVSVESFKIHPEYDNDTLVADLALLYLKDPIPEQPGLVSYIKLPKQGSDPKGNTKLIVAGWGKIADNNNTDSAFLKYTTVPVVDRKTCRKLYSINHDDAKIFDDMICAFKDGEGSCNGDSGGPLFDRVANELIGIVSWGRECSKNGIGGIYVRVGTYVDWIKQNSKPPKISF